MKGRDSGEEVGEPEKGARRNRESSSPETYHSDSFMAKEPALWFLGVVFMKQARSNFLIHLQTVRIEFSILTPGVRAAYISARRGHREGSRS